MSHEEHLSFMKVLERIATALETQAEQATKGMELAEEMKKMVRAMEKAKRSI